MVNNTSTNARDKGSIPGSGIKIPLLQGNWAYAPQLLEPAHSRACAPQQEKPPQWRAHALPWKNSPCSPQQDRKSLHSNKKSSQIHSVVSRSLRPHGLYSQWNSPGPNTGVGTFPFSRGIFLTQGSNPGLPHCRQILYQLSHKRSHGLNMTSQTQT